MDRWEDMRFFLGVARGESLSAAGRALRTDPATVGRRIARLEETLGAALFVKSPQGYALTEAGARLLPHAEAAAQAMEAGQDALGGAEAGLSGQVRIGAPDGLANFVLPQVCAAIAADNPGLEMQIVALPRVVNLSKREADMAIAVSRPTAGRVTVQKITDYRLHLAATRAYLDASPAIEAVRDLGRHRIVGYIPDMIFDKELDYLGALGVDRVALASNSVSVQFQWLRQGAGLGIVHDFTLSAGPDLQRVLPREVSLTRTFYMVRHEEDRRLPRMNRIAEALVQGVRAEVLRLEGLT